MAGALTGGFMASLRLTGRLLAAFLRKQNICNYSLIARRAGHSRCSPALLQGKMATSQILHARPILGCHSRSEPNKPGACLMKTIRFALILLALACLAPWQSAKAADVICYNCPPEWADWASMLKAKAQDALEPYKPAKWDEVPAGLKDPDGYWTTIHSGTLGLFVNKDALGGKPVPACWKDLLKPDYKGMVGYLDPTSAAVGYVGAVAIN